jgi:predicted XRE-type DNA-binding protein
VFADLGFIDAASRQAKLRLAYALNQILEDRHLTRHATGRLLGLSQPKILALKNYKLAEISFERLMTSLTALDHDVEIVITNKPQPHRSARISVVAVNAREWV